MPQKVKYDIIRSTAWLHVCSFHMQSELVHNCYFSTKSSRSPSRKLVCCWYLHCSCSNVWSCNVADRAIAPKAINCSCSPAAQDRTWLWWTGTLWEMLRQVRQQHAESGHMTHQQCMATYHLVPMLSMTGPHWSCQRDLHRIALLDGKDEDQCNLCPPWGMVVVD